MPKHRMVGREKEKVAIESSLRDALESRGRTLLINGEAGIGKTTLVEHLKSEAEALGMIVCLGETTAQESSIPYIPFQRALSGIVDTELFQSEEFVFFDEVFLISKIGLLISHVSRSSEEGMDEDILGSMLTAVQDFVKDSFGGGGAESQKGGLGKLEYMNTKIFIEHGDLVYLAAVTSGEEHPEMKSDIRQNLAEIESEYFYILVDWDGDIDAVAGSNDSLRKLASRKYRVRRSLENLNIQNERLKVQDRIHRILEENAGQRGLVLVLEDIHWADESTLLALPYFVRNTAESRIAIALTYREDELEKKPQSKEVIARLSSEGDCKLIRLEILNDDDVASLISSLLDGGSPPDELMQNLKAETQGNPFFITEVVRGLISEGTLYKDRDVWVLRHGPKTAIPRTVTDLVSKRLESLDLDSIRVLEYAAILGRRFRFDILASGFTMPKDALRETVAGLVSQNLIDAATDNEYTFQHSKMQEVLYFGMSDRWKRVGHRRAGLTYEESFRDSKDDVLFDLAYHFSRTSEHDKGIRYCISAGYKASNNLAPREASQFFEKALELLETEGREDDRSAEINQMLVELYELDGNFEKALTISDSILSMPVDKTRRAVALMQKGRILQSLSKYDDAIQAYVEGISEAEDSGLTLLKAKINGYLGKMHLRKGDYTKAMELQNAYLAESRKFSSNIDIGQAYMNLGGVYLHLNDNQAAVQNWEKSLEFFTEAKYEQGVAYVNDNLGVAHLWSGKFSSALEYYGNSLRIMEKIGDVKGMSSVLLNIGVLYNRMGDYEKSLEYNRRSLQLKRKIGDIVGVANIYNNMAGNYMDMGMFEQSAEHFRLNLELMEKAGDTWGVAQALCNISEPELALGRTAEAEEHCHRSIEMAEAHSFKDIFSYGYMIMGTLHSQRGDYAAADRYFGDSLRYSKETEEPERIGRTYMAMARSYVSRGERERSVDSYSEAYRTFENAQIGALAKRAREEMQRMIEDDSAA